MHWLLEECRAKCSGYYRSAEPNPLVIRGVQGQMHLLMRFLQCVCPVAHTRYSALEECRSKCICYYRGVEPNELVTIDVQS